MVKRLWQANPAELYFSCIRVMASLADFPHNRHVIITGFVHSPELGSAITLLWSASGGLKRLRFLLDTHGDEIRVCVESARCLANVVDSVGKDYRIREYAARLIGAAESVAHAIELGFLSLLVRWSQAPEIDEIWTAPDDADDYAESGGKSIEGKVANKSQKHANQLRKNKNLLRAESIRALQNFAAVFRGWLSHSADRAVSHSAV